MSSSSPSNPGRERPDTARRVALGLAGLMALAIFVSTKGSAPPPAARDRPGRAEQNGPLGVEAHREAGRAAATLESVSSVPTASLGVAGVSSTPAMTRTELDALSSDELIDYFMSLTSDERQKLMARAYPELANTISVNVRVLDALRNTPVVGARLLTGRPLAVKVAETDSRGYATGVINTWLEDGVLFDHPAYVSRTVTLSDAGERVTVRLAPRRYLRGRVLGPGGEPVQGARVSATWRRRGEEGFGPWGGPAQSTSEVDGSFDMRHLPGGTTVILSVRHPRFRETTQTLVTAREPTTVRLKAADRASLACVDVECVDERGAPVSASVYAERDGVESLRRQTADPGEALLLELPPGRHTLIARANGRSNGEQTVDLEPGQRPLVRLTLPTWAVLDCTLTGVPPTARMVTAHCLDDSGYEIRHWWSDDVSLTRPPGPLQLMLVAENQVSPVQHFKLTAGERAQAEFVFGEGLPIQEGSVVDALNGAPLHGAEVIAEWPELAVPSTVTTRSNSKGRFSFYGLRPPTRVSVRREGYANATLSVTGLDAPRIALQPAGSLAVNVVGPGGTPRWATGVALVGPHPLSWTLPGGAWKGVTSQEGTRWRTSAVTDVEGRARFSALAAGTWEVSGAAFAPRRVIVTAGRETQLDIQLD